MSRKFSVPILTFAAIIQIPSMLQGYVSNGFACGLLVAAIVSEVCFPYH